MIKSDSKDICNATKDFYFLFDSCFYPSKNPAKICITDFNIDNNNKCFFFEQQFLCQHKRLKNLTNPKLWNELAMQMTLLSSVQKSQLHLISKQTHHAITLSSSSFADKQSNVSICAKLH